MMQRCGILALAAVGLWACAAPAQVQLKWDFKAGDTFYIEVVSNSKQVLKTVGKELKQDIEQTSVFSVKVLKLNEDKTVELEEKLEWLAVKTGGPMAAADPRYDQQLSGITFKVALDPVKGEVTRFEGYQELLKKIAGDEAAQKAAQAILSEESLKQAVADVFAVVPEKPVKTNDSWLRESERSLGPIGSLKLTKKFVYDGQETEAGKPLEKITFTGTGTYAAQQKSDAAAFQFKVVKGDVKVEDLKGAVWFDAKQDAGRLVKSEWNLKLNGTLTIAVGEGGSQIDTSAQQDLTVKTRVLDKLPERPGAASGPAPPSR